MSDPKRSESVGENAEVATALTILDKWIAMTVHKSQQPGLAAGIVHKGEVIWSKGYGFADMEQKTPVSADTRFRIASITKTFTGTAILQLRDAGKLALDDPLSKYLPWFDLQYPGAPPITIRHVMTHTSGLPRDSTVPHWTEGTFHTWEELVESTKERKPVMPPVKEFKYSNLAFSLLGGVVEAASGQPWAEYVQTEILDPLEMADTLVTPAGDEANLAVGYLRADEEYARNPAHIAATNGFSPSASMASSVNDLVKYARFHLSKEDTAILSGHTLRDMHRIHWLDPTWLWGYGLGVFVHKLDDWTTSGHSGGYNGYLTMFRLCREHDFAVIVLTNALGSDPYQYVERAYKLVLPKVIEASKEKAEAEADWQQYLGSYTADWGDTEIIISDGQLQAISLEFLDMPPIVLEPTDTSHVFTIKSPGNGGETARFEFDDAGTIIRLWWNNEYNLPKRS